MNNEAEREQFEAWRRRTAKTKDADTAIARDGFGEDADYAHRSTQSMWLGWQARAALSPASLETELAAPPHFDVDAMLVACVPGGSSCDPQRVADAIREYCASLHSQPLVAFGCHCDPEPDMKPDGCVWDYGNPKDCVNASRGVKRDECEHWRPITLSPPQPTERSAELEAVQRDAWRPIETAPLGAWVLVAGGPSRSACQQMTGRTVDRMEWVSGDDGYSMYLNPTHWMPLPPAPIAAAPQKGEA